MLGIDGQTSDSNQQIIQAFVARFLKLLSQHRMHKDSAIFIER